MKNIIFYLPLFYPDKKRFYKILDLFEKYKVDYVEIGLPAEDPYMDGERIFRAHQQILQMQYSDMQYLETLVDIHEKYSFSVILMGYYRDFMRFPAFYKDESKRFFDAVLCVDIPADGTQKNNIPIINEQNTDSEIKQKISNNPLFVYVMSSMGKTGSGELRDNYIETMKRVKNQKMLPCFVGFQIKTEEDVKRVLKNGADGAIIGSELLKQVDISLEMADIYIKNICMVKEQWEKKFAYLK
ncbi:tryptophan synthase subunit alpha [Clostridiales bacterium COT073_COT-073]|nr:tryptophan synthase subunit alpha [Clostridiales bacterium COT073_COT-073]